MELPWLRCPEPLCGKGARRSGGLSRGNRCLCLRGPNPGLLCRATLARLGRGHRRPPQDGSSPQTPGAVGYGSSVLADPPQPSASSLWSPAPGRELPPALSSQPVALTPYRLPPQQPEDPPSARRLPPDQHHARTAGSEGPGSSAGAAARQGRGGKQGKGSSRGVCVCARGCVCVHILTEGLSPRLAGPRGEKEGAT